MPSSGGRTRSPRPQIRVLWIRGRCGCRERDPGIPGRRTVMLVKLRGRQASSSGLGVDGSTRLFDQNRKRPEIRLISSRIPPDPVACVPEDTL